MAHPAKLTSGCSIFHLSTLNSLSSMMLVVYVPGLLMSVKSIEPFSFPFESSNVEPWTKPEKLPEGSLGRLHVTPPSPARANHSPPIGIEVDPAELTRRSAAFFSRSDHGKGNHRNHLTDPSQRTSTRLPRDNPPPPPRISKHILSVDDDNGCLGRYYRGAGGRDPLGGGQRRGARRGAAGRDHRDGELGQLVFVWGLN